MTPRPSTPRPLPSPFRLRPTLPLLALALACGHARAGAPLYHLEVLGVADGTSAVVTDINDAGQAVGDFLDADFNGRAVLWNADGSTQVLGVPGSGDTSAAAINDQGQIVGTFMDYANPVVGLLWDAATPAQATNLGDDPGVNVAPSDINDDGVVVGGFGLPAASRAFVWTAATGVVDYGVEDPDVEFQQVSWSAVNASGKLVGHSNVHSSTINAVGGQVGTPAVVSLGPMSAQYPTAATALNAAGTVVGVGLAVDEPTLVPVQFAEDGSFAEIPGAKLDQESGCAAAINDAGVVVGSAGIGTASGCAPGAKAWVYRDGTAYDLYEVVDDTAGFVRFEIGRAINDAGVIVGTGRDADGNVGSFKLTPIATDAIFADGFDG